jgi:hypothetical protein
MGCGTAAHTESFDIRATQEALCPRSPWHWHRARYPEAWRRGWLSSSMQLVDGRRRLTTYPAEWVVRRHTHQLGAGARSGRMTTETPSTKASPGDPRRGPLFHGTRSEFGPGDLIEPSKPADQRDSDGMADYVYLTPDADGAIWEAELATGEGRARVYVVEPLGPVEDATAVTDRQAPGHPWMSWRSREPLRVKREMTEWPLLHGTRADLKPGDLIKPGHVANFGSSPRTANHVYMTRTMDAAKWGAELAAGEGPGRIYVVEPTGPIEDDPNLTDKKYRGNPTRSFRSREPLLVVREVRDWREHSVEAVQAMKEGLARLEQTGAATIDD